MRKELQFTQAEFAAYLSRQDDELNAVDVVTINRWENDKVKPSTYKALKILNHLDVDLYSSLKSFEPQPKETIIDQFLAESFCSFQSRIASIANLNKQVNKSDFTTLPLMINVSDNSIIDRMKLLAVLTKMDLSPLESIDLYLYLHEKKAYGQKVVDKSGNIVSHNLGFFFDDQNFGIYKNRKIELKDAISLNSNRDINYLNLSSHAENNIHAIDNIIEDIKLLSKNSHIKTYSVLVKDKNAIKVMKSIGFEVFKFSSLSPERMNITFKNKPYCYCILTIDKIEFLTNRHVMSLIKEQDSTMKAFPHLLRETRKNLKLTQKDFAAHINHLDNEFSSVDVVTVNRWENNKVKPSTYKALKILDCLGVDLYTTLKSFDSEDNEDNTLLEEFLSERFFSFQSRIASITKGELDEDNEEFRVMSLMADQHDKDILDRIKLISQYTKVDPSALDTIDLFLYICEKKAYGRKILNKKGDIVSHSLGFFFNQELFEEYQNKNLHIKQACSLDSNQDLNYVVVSGHSEKREHSIVNLVSDMKLLAKNPNIKRFSMLIKNPKALELMKNLGFEIFKFSEPTDEKSNIIFKNKSYRYCIMTIDKIDLLSNKHVISFINKYG
ncbi:helix-turn-helix transcriptional regulator [Vibrio chagasii]